MADRRNPIIGVEEVQSILSVLAKILAKGLAAEQREHVLRDTPIVLDSNKRTDEFSFYRALLDAYEANTSLDYILDVTQRIEATRSFYQDVGPDLDQLRYLLKTLKIGRQEAQSQKPYVFALMPFRPEYFALYERAIKPTLEELGCTVEHANEVNTIERIVDTIFTQISKARFLIADTTGKNPNVFYELGYAHALGKKVILLIQDTRDISFDIAGLRHIPYKPEQIHALCMDLKNIASALLETQPDSILA